MKLPSVRIGTLMLLVVIAGLAIALAAQEQRHANALAANKQDYAEKAAAIRTAEESRQAEFKAKMQDLNAVQVRVIRTMNSLSLEQDRARAKSKGD